MRYSARGVEYRSKWPTPQHSNTPALQSLAVGSSHPHDIVTRVYVDHLAGDSAAPVAAQKKRGFAHLLRIDISFERRPFADVMKHIFETGNPCRRQGPDRSSGYSVDTNPFGAQIVRKVANTRFQCGFRDPHDIVIGNDFFRSHVGHGKYRRLASLHEWCGMACERDKRIGTHVHS